MLTDRQRIDNLKRNIKSVKKSRYSEVNKSIMIQSLQDEIKRLTDKEVK